MVNVKIMLHNISHILMPIIIIGIARYYLVEIEFNKLAIAAIVGSFFPDIDHLTMRKLYRHLNFWRFIKEVMKAERYRRSFLFFHNRLTILTIFILLPIVNSINVYLAIFFLAFLAHLIMDYLADVLIIKTHSHWKFKRWL